jgi:hypothetical protein
MTTYDIAAQIDIDNVLSNFKNIIKNINITGFILYNGYSLHTTFIQIGTSPGIKQPGDVFFMLELALMTNYAELPIPYSGTITNQLTIILLSGKEQVGIYELNCINTRELNYDSNVFDY